jgi:phosphatidylglycerophosphate synthase
MLDGMVAIASGRASAVGELFNEVPDRISDTATLVGLGYAVGGNVTLGFTAACVALFTAYARAMGKVAGARQEFCGPMAKQQRMLVATLVALYCGLTPESWQPRWDVSPSSAGLPTAALVLIIVGGLATAVRRLARIARTLTKGHP